MSDGGQTGKDVSGWTVDTLKAWTEDMFREKQKQYDRFMEEQEKRQAERHDSQKETTTAALKMIDSRFEQVNEWRRMVEALAHQTMPRVESERMYHTLSEKVDAMEKRIDIKEGRGAGLHAGWLYLVGALGFLLTIGTLVNLYLNMKGVVP